MIGGKAKDNANKAIISKLGGKTIEDVDEEFDVYITDGKLVRNCKLLLAISTGAPVVNVNWLKDSNKGKRFIDDYEKYFIIDREFEKAHNCDLLSLYEDD